MVRHHPATVETRVRIPVDAVSLMYFDVPIEDKKKTDWKTFENDVADVFEHFGYNVERDVRFKTVARFQIDVVAYNEKRCFFVDCKDHGYIAPSEEEVFIAKQKIRAENYVKTKPELQYKRKIILLVTRHGTSSVLNHIEAIGKVLGVDLNRLQDLLMNITMYEDELYSFY